MKETQILRDQILEQARVLLNHAETYYGRSLPWPEFDWSLTGRCAGQMIGQFQGRQSLKMKCRLNKELLELHFDEFIEQILPHEMAHLVVMAIFGTSRKIKPHGPQWQSVMGQCFQRPADIYHSLALTEDLKHCAVMKPRQMKYHDYHCRCRNHKLSQVRHNRVKKGTIYTCCVCKTALEADLSAHQPQLHHLIETQ